MVDGVHLDANHKFPGDYVKYYSESAYVITWSGDQTYVYWYAEILDEPAMRDTIPFDESSVLITNIFRENSLYG